MVKSHSVSFLDIQGHPLAQQGAFSWPLDSAASLRRSGSSSQNLNRAQDFPEQWDSARRHISQLERNGLAAMPGKGLSAGDLHQLAAQRRHRTVHPGSFDDKASVLHEVAQIEARQGVQASDRRRTRHSLPELVDMTDGVQLMAFLPSLRCSAQRYVPRLDPGTPPICRFDEWTRQISDDETDARNQLAGGAHSTLAHPPRQHPRDSTVTATGLIAEPQAWKPRTW